MPDLTDAQRRDLLTLADADNHCQPTWITNRPGAYPPRRYKLIHPTSGRALTQLGLAFTPDGDGPGDNHRTPEGRTVATELRADSCHTGGAA